MDYKSSNKIVQGAMKNMQVSKTKRKKSPASARSSDSNSGIQQSPALKELQKKYLSQDSGYQPDSFAARPSGKASRGSTDGDVDVKIITSKNKRIDDAGGAKERTVILSKKKGLLGSQG